MSITAKVRIEHEKLALVPTLQRLDDVTIRVVAQGNTAPGTTVFPFLIQYDERGELERTFDQDPTVEEYKLIDWTDRTGIYYIEHTDETKLISTVVTDVNGFLAHTETKGESWIARLLLPDRDALNTVWEFARDHDIELDIIEIYGNDEAGTDTSYGLTDEQLAALRTAYASGYFDEPRDVALDEIGEEMGLSSTAISGRLRRGMRNLIDATLIKEDEE